MRIDDVPQDQSRTYHGHRKILYATRNGRYEAAPSNGWAAEEYATEQAVAGLHGQALAAYAEAASGKRSPLYYYMYCYRHDETSLAQSTGIWRWRVRRHFRPEVFARLPESVLRRYARAFHLPPEVLKTLPPAPLNPFAGEAD